MKSLIALLFFFGFVAVVVRAEDLKTVDSFRDAAAKANSILTLPDWDQTPEAVEASMKNAIATANAALDQIGKQDLTNVTLRARSSRSTISVIGQASPRIKRPSSRRRILRPPCALPLRLP